MPILETALAVGGSLANTASQIITNKANRRAAELAYNRQRADALSDYDRQNAYNDPKQQMERYRKAGLNPNLMYGSGGSSSTAAQVQQSQMKVPEFQAPQTDIGGVLAQFLNMERTRVQTDFLEKQIQLAESSKRLNYGKLDQTSAQTNFTEFQTQRGQSLLKGDLQAQEYSNKKAELDITRMATNNEIQAATKAATIQEAIEKVVGMRLQQKLQESSNQKNLAQRQQIEEQIRLVKKQINSVQAQTEMQQLENQLMREGATKGDPAWIRGIIQQANKYSLLDKLKNWWNTK